MKEENENEKLAPSKLPPAVEVRIRRGFIGEITIHQVTDEELVTLTHGYPDSVYLNFSIFLLSMAISFLTALITTDVSGRVFNVFVILVVLGLILGFLFLVLWFRNRSSTADLVRRTRDRLPPKGLQEELPVIDVPKESD
jgi:amino acid transporter